MSWQGAVQYWAEKAGCAELDFVGSSQFARVWTYSLIYGLVMTIGITVPFRWCASGKAGIKIADEPDGDTEEGGDAAKKKLQETLTGLGEDIKPDKEAAKRHLIRTSATIHGKWMSPLWTPTYRLSEIGGTGTELYFRTLRNFFFIFAYMAGITGPLLAFSMLGTFGPDNGQFLVKTTIGNLGEFVAADLIDPWNRVVRLGCEGMEINKLTGIFGWLDFAAVIVFLVYLLWARFLQIPRCAMADDLEQVTPRDYSVVIEGLPAKVENHKDYERLLKEHLVERLQYTRSRRHSPWELPPVEVEELTIVRDYRGRLHELKDRAHLEQRVRIAEAYVQNGGSTRRLDKLRAQLE
ncbi:unnamed protein product, partial [Effrenium voratum]